MRIKVGFKQILLYASARVKRAGDTMSPMSRIALLSLMCLPLCAADAHMTEAERTKVMNWLEESRKEFLAAIDGVTEEQWRWKPAPERWSVGETAEHI